MAYDSPWEQDSAAWPPTCVILGSEPAALAALGPPRASPAAAARLLLLI
jgi:hypothetical protein